MQHLLLTTMPSEVLPFHLVSQFDGWHCIAHSLADYQQKSVSTTGMYDCQHCTEHLPPYDEREYVSLRKVKLSVLAVAFMWPQEYDHLSRAKP